MMMFAGSTAPLICNQKLESNRAVRLKVKSRMQPIVQGMKERVKRATWTPAMVETIEKVTTEEQIGEFAKNLGLMAGDIIRRGINQENMIEEKSSSYDLVTNIDRECEAEITKAIHDCYPDHQIVGEETASDEEIEAISAMDVEAGDDVWRWIVDPIDGTMNFIYEVPLCAVSIAVARGSQLVAGVIYDPFRDELFWARRDGGAWLNDRQISLEDKKSMTLKDAVIAYGCSSVPERRVRGFEYAKRISANCMSMRLLGSAALHLAYTAAGRFDGYYEAGLKPWDAAAGRILVAEAGGRWCDFDGSSAKPLGPGPICAAVNSQVVDELLQFLD